MRLLPHAAIALILAGCSSTPATEATVDPSTEVQSRRTAIDKEFARLGGDPAWAGAYVYSPGGLSFQSIRLAPEAGYVHEKRDCLGAVHRCEGDVRWEDGELHLVPVEPEAIAFPHFDGESSFVILVDGNRRVLIPKRAMKAVRDLDTGGVGWSDGAEHRWFVASRGGLEPLLVD